MGLRYVLKKSEELRTLREPGRMKLCDRKQEHAFQ